MDGAVFIASWLAGIWYYLMFGHGREGILKPLFFFLKSIYLYTDFSAT
jgi:hypothetical protein